MIDTVILIHAKDDKSTASSLGALYALAIAYQSKGEDADFWPPINKAIQERFGGNGTTAGMKKLDLVKKRGWRLHEQVVEHVKETTQ